MGMRMVRVVVVLLGLVLATPAAAQSFTDPQVATIKAAILADPALNATADTYPDGARVLAGLLNANASPAFIVWKSSESIREVGKAFDGGELSGLTSLNHTRLQTLGVFLSGGVSPQRANHRQFFDDIFSGAGGANTRASLLALWKRSARYIEKILATGTGSDASPGTLVFEGTITPEAAHNARRSGS